jgi:hypothetical protein
VVEIPPELPEAYTKERLFRNLFSCRHTKAEVA